ncbi:MAG: hypothetical protein IKE66_14375 [Hyphomicrobium sp.]|nr:hypothetical protein [Hyphomicrobium sp.]
MKKFLTLFAVVLFSAMALVTSAKDADARRYGHRGGGAFAAAILGTALLYGISRHHNRRYYGYGHRRYYGYGHRRYYGYGHRHYGYGGFNRHGGFGRQHGRRHGGFGRGHGGPKFGAW